MKIYVKSAIPVAAIAEILGPIVIELLGKYWETHKNDMVKEISSEAGKAVENQPDDNPAFAGIKGLIAENSDIFTQAVEQIILNYMGNNK